MSLSQEIRHHCVPDFSKAGSFFTKEAVYNGYKTVRGAIHVPFFPAFHRPGWLLRYVVGPYDAFWRESVLADFWAGITVALLLIPQALSYATIANMPPINGLYASVLPSAVYTFFGSSMQLAVGAVAICCLLIGALVSQYGVVPGSEESVQLGGEIALATGTILTVMSILNMGNLIRYISFPVMSGFTSAAASLIAMNQIKHMFGFTNSYFPQTGDGKAEENWQVMDWIIKNYGVAVTPSPTSKPSFLPTAVPTFVSGATYANGGNSPAPTSAIAFPTASPTPKPSSFAPTKEWSDASNWGGLPANAKSALAKSNINWQGEGKSNLNPYSIAICFGLWIVLALINSMRKRFKATPERKKSTCFKIWTTVSAISPFFAIIIGAGIAAKIKQEDDQDNWNIVWLGKKYGLADAGANHNYYKYSLKVVGPVASGINILRTPSLKWPFGTLLVDVIPLTLIAFMESWAVARKMAVISNELHVLNASQELWAIGLANLLASVGSAFPVAGSFSRSSLNLASGARTPLSKVTTLIVLIITLTSLTETFGYIPQAALAAVIIASVTSLIDLRDFWNAWKYSKKDFFVMIFTANFTFVFDTKWGLLAGIGMSFAIYIGELAFASESAPKKLFSHHKENNGIEVIKLESDLVFLTAARVKDFLTSAVFKSPVKATKEEQSIHTRAFNAVHGAFDYVVQPNLIKPFHPEQPVAVVVDFAAVHHVDISGAYAIQEWAQNARADGILIVFINTSDGIFKFFDNFGMKSDSTTEKVDLDAYADKISLAIRKVESKVEDAWSTKSGKGGGATSGKVRRGTAFASELQMDTDEERPASASSDEWDTVNGGKVRRAAAETELVKSQV